MNIEIPYLKGKMHCVLMPNALNDDKKWYINDHCILKDKENTYHFFGINNPYPENMDILYSWHPHIAHAISKNPLQGFERVGFAIDDRQGEEYVGAPYVVWLEEKQTYLMIFESKIESQRTLEYAYSKDLYNWERMREPAFTNLGYTRRDPCVLKENGMYNVYICNPEKGGSSVSLTQTKDFIDVSNTKTCFKCYDGLDWGGCESPFVVKRKDLYYLFFTYAHHQYNETRVFVSTQFDTFKPENQIATLYGHASEIFEMDGKQYITNCGPEDDHLMNEHALYISELCWTKEEFEIQ